MHSMLVSLGTVPRKGHVRQCLVCGADYYQAPRRARKYCSRPCADLGRHRGTVKICEHCASPMNLRISELPRRYCSWDCKVTASIKRPVGRVHNGKPVRQLPDGYLMVWEPEHPRNNKGWMLEHRLVMEKVLGRHLGPEEEVDHINQVRHDNRPENLQALLKAEHRRKTGVDNRKSRLTMRQRLAEYERLYGPLPSD